MITDITESIQDAIQYHDQPLALEVLTYIAKNNFDQISQEDLHRLGYVRFSSLSTLKASMLLKESLIIAYTIPNFVLSDELIKYIEQIDVVPSVIEFVDRVDYILEEHSEMLGSNTIGQYIKDYHAFAKNEGDAFIQTKYINTSTKAHDLNKQDREILVDILKIYDYCNNVLQFWHLLEEMPKEEISKYINPETSWRDLLPGVVDSSATSVIASNIDAARTAPKPIAPPKPVVPVNPAPTPPRAPTPTPPPVPTAPAAPITKPVFADKNHVPPLGNQAKIHDLINHVPQNIRGVVRDKTNIVMDDEQRRLAKEQADKEAQIQQKLADLRNRNKK